MEVKEISLHQTKPPPKPHSKAYIYIKKIHKSWRRRPWSGGEVSKEEEEEKERTEKEEGRVESLCSLAG